MKQLYIHLKSPGDFHRQGSSFNVTFSICLIINNLTDYFFPLFFFVDATPLNTSSPKGFAAVITNTFIVVLAFYFHYPRKNQFLQTIVHFFNFITFFVTTIVIVYSILFVLFCDFRVAF